MQESEIACVPLRAHRRENPELVQTIELPNVAYGVLTDRGVLTDKGVMTVFKVSHTNFVCVLSLKVLTVMTTKIP